MGDRDPGGGANLFLITGCQRSGTTLAAMALEAHPLIEIIEEDDARFHVRSGAAVTKKLDLDAVSDYIDGRRGPVGFKAPRESHRVPAIAGKFPSIRGVWMQRAIHQVVSSMVSLTSPVGTWASLYAPKEIDKHIAKTGDEGARAALAFAGEIEDRDSRSVALATLCWLVKREQKVLAARSLGSRLFLLEYDALVTKPGDTLQELLHFLHVPWGPEVLDHPSNLGSTLHPGAADVARPIDTTSLMKWKSVLAPRDLEIIERVRRVFEDHGSASPPHRWDPGEDSRRTGG